nr:O-antigen polysaccharide polymerase Wzy family protein [uncultured Blautia sp.]
MLKVRSLFTMLGIITMILIGALNVSTNSLFVIILSLWAIMFIYTLDNISKNIVMCSFLLSFFVFLLGREFIYEFFGGERLYSFLDVTNNQTFVIILISLLGIFGGSYYIKSSFKFTERKGRKIKKVGKDVPVNRGYQLACKLMFYVCYFASLVSVAYQIIFVKNVGYLASYTSEAGGSGVPSVVAYVANFTPVILSMYLATCPDKIKVIFPMALYELYALLTLLTGQRYPFIGISLYILTYWFLRERNEGGWIKKWYYIAIIVMLPILMLGVTAYDSIRVGEKIDFHNVVDGFRDFFVDQGGSINVIRRTIYNANQLRDMPLVSFSSTYSTVCGNVIARKLFGITVYSGNSVEHAMLGHSLAHRLSYYAYGNGYLAGRGTGTSYIAELFHDFSYIGVFIGSFVYGVLIEKINRIDFKAYIKNGFLLALLYYIYLLPRGSFDGFVGGVFNIYSIFLWFITYVLSKLLGRKNKVRYGVKK